VRACSLRLTNVYAHGKLMKHNRQGFIGGSFVSRGIEDKVMQTTGMVTAPRLRLRG